MTNIIDDKYIVIKIEDIEKYLTTQGSWILCYLQQEILAGREADGKKLNDYWVCNRDEEYADKVLQIILNGENNKKEK